MPGTPDKRHGWRSLGCATVLRRRVRMLSQPQPLDLRDRHVRYGCLLMIAAVGLSVGYASIWQSAQFASSSPHWTAARWISGYLVFVGAYLATFVRRVQSADIIEWGLLALQAVAALFLVWLHPS